MLRHHWLIIRTIDPYHSSRCDLLNHRQTATSYNIYPLVNSHISMKNHGKSHDFSGHAIQFANCSITRGYILGTPRFPAKKNPKKPKR